MIDSFIGENMFLSNFYLTPVEYEGIVYPSSEHAYQAAKSISQDTRRTIAGLATPGMAKKHGRRIELRPDWEQIKDNVMEKILKSKFSDPLLEKKLRDTGDVELIEGNWWGDQYWGATKPDPKGGWIGENKLGKLLMKLRGELQEHKVGSETV